MKMVVDTGALRKPPTVEYLRADSKNELIFIDFLCMECLKGSDPVYNFTCSLQNIIPFGDQIIILKPTQVITQICATPEGRQERFIDIDHTNSFRRFLKSLAHAVEVDAYAKNEIQRRGKIATDYFDKLLLNHESLVRGIHLLNEKLDPNDKRLLKNRTLSAQALDFVLFLARAVYDEHRRSNPGTNLNSSVRLSDEFVFRYSLASTLMMLWWVEHGGYENVLKNKLRNDNTDMLFVTYASYYDGLITCDNKAVRIHALHREILKLLDQ